MVKKEVGEKEEVGVFLEIVKKVEKDPEVRERMEENQRRYGTLTEEDLKKVFTI